MATVAFDTLQFANRLKAAGVPDQQVEAQAAALAEALGINLKELATKQDLRILEPELKGERRLLKGMIGFSLAGMVSILFILLRIFIELPKP